jgi:hypothetical protein
MQRLRKQERALIEGEWFNHAKGTHTFGAIAIGVGLTVGAGAAIYATSSQNSIANKELGIANSQQGKQDIAFNQLQQLISNPGSFFDNPVFTSAANQGGAQVARQNAAAFGPNSGNEATALQAYGQTFGQQQFLEQEQLLAGMSGTGFNPVGGASAASGAVQSSAGSLASLGGLLSFFGSSGAGAGGAAGSGGAANYGAWSSGGAGINFDGAVTSSEVLG